MIGKEEIIKTLLSKGASANAADGYGKPALSIAAVR
jgi:ankyrin repeat protein|eukprot:COSAG06_NODE_7_length_38054_cov_37.302569_27_plen_36_part_00